MFKVVYTASPKGDLMSMVWVDDNIGSDASEVEVCYKYDGDSCKASSHRLHDEPHA